MAFSAGATGAVAAGGVPAFVAQAYARARDGGAEVAHSLSAASAEIGRAGSRSASSDG